MEWTNILWSLRRTGSPKIPSSARKHLTHTRSQPAARSAKSEVETYSLEAMDLGPLGGEIRPICLLTGWTSSCSLLCWAPASSDCRNDLAEAASLTRSAVSTARNVASDSTTQVQHNIPVILNNTEFLRTLGKTSTFARSNSRSFLFRNWVPMWKAWEFHIDVFSVISPGSRRGALLLTVLSLAIIPSALPTALHGLAKNHPLMCLELFSE